ncbi:MAG: hypothetical protein O9325_22290, partial [Roseomonas sp.]|nr:hypothetical protein [Roseomonas sp.]
AALVAGVSAFGAAWLGRAAGRPLLGAAAGGIGVLAGCWFAFGVVTASPRQLPERLLLLMLALVLATPLFGAAARWRRWLAVPLAVAGALWAGWWMAGAPIVPPDLARAAPVLVAVAIATLLLALTGGPRWAGPVAASVLFVGLYVAPLAGPYRLLGGVVLASAAMAALVRPGKSDLTHPVLTALPLAVALAALAAIPVLARGAASDFAVAAAPLAALLIGIPAGARLAGRRWGAPAGAGLVGGLAVGVAFLLR